LAIITMQRTPQTSWPQRGATDRAASDWTVGDPTVIVSVPRAFLASDRSFVLRRFTISASFCPEERLYSHFAALQLAVQV
jgi:hypothetical protein